MKFEITKEQILSAYESKENLRELFPDAFKITSGWYNDSEYPQWLLFFNMEKGVYYGFNHHGEWCEGDVSREIIHETESKATEEEVFEALKKEAIKRGFGKKGIHFKDVNGDNCVSDIEIDFWNKDNKHCSEDNKFNISVCKSGGVIYRKGKWATIIETITKKQAEKLLDKKIID